MWSILKGIKKFTKKSDLDVMIGKPKFQIENRPAYYYGGGIVIYFSPKCFRIEGIQRVEYGETDEYAVGLFHFPEVSVLITEFGLNSFPVNDAVPLEDDIIDGIVTYHSTFNDIHKYAIENPLEDYREGEKRRLVDDKVVFKEPLI